MLSVRKHEGKRALGRCRHRWEGNIKIALKELGLDGVDCIHLAQGRVKWRAVMNMVMNIWVQ
jgi:hypothetical protein